MKEKLLYLMLILFVSACSVAQTGGGQPPLQLRAK